MRKRTWLRDEIEISIDLPGKVFESRQTLRRKRFHIAQEARATRASHSVDRRELILATQPRDDGAVQGFDLSLDFDGETVRERDLFDIAAFIPIPHSNLSTTTGDFTGRKRCAAPLEPDSLIGAEPDVFRIDQHQLTVAESENVQEPCDR